MYKFHMLGLVHLPCSKEYLSCAFTQKNHKLARMLMSMGHEVYYYGLEGSTVPCTKFIQTHSLSDVRKEWGDGDNRFDLGYNWKETDFRHDFNTQKTETTRKFYSKCIEEINNIKKPDDFLLLTQGFYHKPIDDGVKLFLTCEPGIGYRGSYCKFRAFESAYIQNFTYGSEHPRECINGNYYDRVIPNYFDPADVEFEANPKGDYYFFIARMIKLKGIITAYMTCKALNKKLIIAGQGAKVMPNGSLKGPDFTLPPATWEFVGYAGRDKRVDLMKNAIATFTPTEYLECFAGTHIESMLHGTPVLTTNFGVFPGTVINGVNGYRSDTLDDFVNNAKIIGKLDRTKVYQSAQRYFMDYVKYEFQKWFDDMYQVYLSTNGKTPGWSLVRNESPEWRNKLI